MLNRPSKSSPMKSHPTLVSALAILWLLTFSSLAYAATVLPPFSQDFRGFDFESALLAAGAGLIGGAGRTLYSLATEKVIVGNLWREALKDAALALLGGVVIWGLVTMLANFFPQYITSGVRFLAIVLTGASRGKWANALGDFISAGLGALKTRVVAWASGQSAPSTESPPSAITPLQENPK